MKSKKIIVFLLLTFAIVINGNAQKTLSRIIKSGEFRVGLTGTQPPFNMKSKTGELMGFEIDLATVLSNGMGVKLTTVVMPFAELLPALEAGKIDAIMSGMTVTAERNVNALFVGPYVVSGKSILAKSSVLSKLKGTDEANSAANKIVSLKGSTSEVFANKYMPKAQKIAVENYDQGIAMVLNDQADAMVADFPICVITIMRNQGKDLVTLDGPLNIEPISMAIPPGDLHFDNLISNYLKAFEMAGALKALDDKWLKDGSWLFNME